MDTMYTHKKKRTFFDNLSAIASICSAALTATCLAWKGILPITTVAVIMTAVVVLAAIGKPVAKLVGVGISAYLFAKIMSGGSRAIFQHILGELLTLMIALTGLFFIIRGRIR